MAAVLVDRLLLLLLLSFCGAAPSTVRWLLIGAEADWNESSSRDSMWRTILSWKGTSSVGCLSLMTRSRTSESLRTP